MCSRQRIKERREFQVKKEGIKRSKIKVPLRSSFLAHKYIQSIRVASQSLTGSATSSILDDDSGNDCWHLARYCWTQSEPPNMLWSKQRWIGSSTSSNALRTPVPCMEIIEYQSMPWWHGRRVDRQIDRQLNGGQPTYVHTYMSRLGLLFQTS